MTVPDSAALPKLIVFAKPPKPGEAKTRLAADLGLEGAARLAQSFLRDTLMLSAALPGHDVVLATVAPVQAYAPPDSPLGRQLAPLQVWSQGEGDLGQRLERAIRRALETAPHALVLGTDSPGLPLGHLEAAVRCLQQSEAVLGPADDGGYYLIGMRRCPLGALHDLPWSSPKTCEANLERFFHLGLRPALAPRYMDVDTGEDLQRLLAQLQRGRISAPFTASALREMGLLRALAEG